MMVGPAEAQEWMWEAKWQNTQDDFWDAWFSTWSPHGPIKAHKIATNLLQAIPRVFPACRDCLLFKHTKDKSIFLQHSRFHAINITQPAPALSPEWTEKRQSAEWKITSASELASTAEHCVRSLEHNHKQKSTKWVTLQLQHIQGHVPEINPGCPHHTL